jgi:hypothetical protein
MRNWRKKPLAVAALTVLVSGPAGTPSIVTAAGDAPAVRDHDRDGGRTATPIKHVIVIIGENRTFDNVPNPLATAGNPYVPLNMPAIGDLFDMFDFHGDWNQDHQGKQR